MKIFNFLLIFTLCMLLFIACNNDAPPTTPDVAGDINATGNPAIDALTKTIATTPNDPELYAQRGALFYENEGYDNAIEDLTKAIAIDSSKAQYFHLLADAYLDYTRSRLALRTMEKAARLFPERMPTLLKLCEFQLILKKYPESLKTIDKILQIDPQNADAWYMMGMNFKEMGDRKRAINSFQTAVENNPDLINSWLELAHLFSEENHPLAERYFDNAIKVDEKNTNALHAKAYYLSNKKNELEEAIELYKKINTIDPHYEEAFYNAGLLYLDLKKTEEAYQQFDFCVKTSPTHIRCYYYRGLAAEFNGDREAAKADYERALKMYPDYDKAQEGLERVK